jgi:hypothetical protein
MCNVDIGVFGSVWVHSKSEGLRTFVDFNTKHTCRNFEDVKAWAQEHQMTEDLPLSWLEPPHPEEGTKIWEGAP